MAVAWRMPLGPIPKVCTATKIKGKLDFCMIKNLRLKGHHREREKTEHGTGEDIHDHKSDKSAVSIINEECVQS